MSAKEHERAVVLERVVERGLRLEDAAVLMGVCYRQAKRLVARYRAGGRAALVHGGVGKASNRARPAAERARVLRLVEEKYGGNAKRGPAERFGPTLAAEHLQEEDGIEIPRRTLHDWMVQAGQWSRVRRSRVRPRRRERRRHFGELVQLDGSFHDWYEGRGERAGARSCVMNMVDDATGETLLRFGEQETIWAAAFVLQEWIALYGVPRALYTDWNTIYKREPRPRERILGLEVHTAFGLMCKKLGIEVIGAGSPQAKGRIERSNGVHQDRLIKKMRRVGIEDDAAANAYVRERYLAAHNARFAQAPADHADYHLALDASLNLDDVFCLESERVVSKDFVVQFDRRGLQLDRRARGRVPAGSKVLVRQTEDGRVRVIHRRANGQEHECAWTPAAPRTQRRSGESSSAAATSPGPTLPRTQIGPQKRNGAGHSGRKATPAPKTAPPDHPWRRAPALGRGPTFWRKPSRSEMSGTAVVASASLRPDAPTRVSENAP